MSLPEPPVPLDADCRQLNGFLLNVERLLSSELWALSSGDELKAALALWCKAWKQVPAGSLPDDDRVLAVFSYTGNRWRKVREMALHGFVKCSDGRLYHPVLCEDVMRALDHQKQYRDRRERDAKRLSAWREKRTGNTAGNGDETGFETRVETVSRRSKETIQDKKKREREGAHARGSLSEDLISEWIEEAKSARAEAGLMPVNLQAEWTKYVATKGPPEHGRWLLWAMNARVINGVDAAGDEAKRDRPTGPPPPLPVRC